MAALAIAPADARGAAGNPFLAAMADAPGEGTPLLVYADWLDEHSRPELAAAIRERTPALLTRYARASASIDAMLAVDLGLAEPVRMPRPDRGCHCSRQQWVAVVRAALRPFEVPYLSFGATTGWRGGPDVEVRVPPADFVIADGIGGVLKVPWGMTSAGMLAAGVEVFAVLMPLLFPNEPPRVVHADGETFPTAFWRIAVRPQT